MGRVFHAAIKLHTVPLNTPEDWAPLGMPLHSLYTHRHISSAVTCLTSTEAITLLFASIPGSFYTVLFNSKYFLNIDLERLFNLYNEQ